MRREIGCNKERGQVSYEKQVVVASKKKSCWPQIKIAEKKWDSSRVVLNEEHCIVGEANLLATDKHYRGCSREAVNKQYRIVEVKAIKTVFGNRVSMMNTYCTVFVTI